MPQTLADAPLRFPVQYVARPHGNACPRVHGPRSSRERSPSATRSPCCRPGCATRVREIRTCDGDRSRAPGCTRRSPLVLDDELDISRGDMLVGSEAAPSVSRAVDATLCWLGDAPLDLQRKYLLRHTTRETRARIDGIDHLWNVSTQAREPAPGKLGATTSARVRLSVAQPVFADRYDDNRATGSFILIDESTNGTVGAGMIR